MQEKEFPKSSLIAASDDNGSSSDAKLAQAEEDHLAQIEKEEDLLSHGRRQKVADELLRCGIWGIRAGVILGAVGVFIWAYHILTPTDWQWLDDKKFEILQNMIFSGSLSSVLTILSQNVYKKKSV